jgi:uncharacterized protein YjiS (DUF1127 family)
MSSYHRSVSLEAPVAVTQRLAESLVRRLAPALRCALATYRRHRTYARAIAQLQSMSDRELRDIGMHRGDIERQVRGEIDEGRRARGLLA